MRAVSPFETNLLRILHCFLGRVPLERALPLIAKELPAQACLSRDAVELVKDALAKGCLQVLAQDGGWRRERFLRGDEIAEGRLWERTPPADLGLAFSGRTLEFLIWITARKPTLGKTPQRFSGRAKGSANQEPTHGDRLLFFLAYQALRETEVALPLFQQGAFASEGLLWLAFASDFAEYQTTATLKFGHWMMRCGTCILEAFQARFADCWVEMEQQKQTLTDLAQINTIGQAQEKTLNAFMKAVDGAGRWDLARFLLSAAARLIKAPPKEWLGRLAVHDLRVAERMESYRNALMFFHQLLRLQEWQQAARNVGYLDEGYANSQLWKSEWERWNGDEMCDRAREIIGWVQPLGVCVEE